MRSTRIPTIRRCRRRCATSPRAVSSRTGKPSSAGTATATDARRGRVVRCPREPRGDGFRDLGDDDLYAPPLMWSEARSALHELAWRGEIPTEDARDALGRLERCPVKATEHRELGETAWQIADELGCGEALRRGVPRACPAARLPRRHARRTASCAARGGSGSSSRRTSSLDARAAEAPEEHLLDLEGLGDLHPQNGLQVEPTPGRGGGADLDDLRGAPSRRARRRRIRQTSHETKASSAEATRTRAVIIRVCAALEATVEPRPQATQQKHGHHRRCRRACRGSGRRCRTACRSRC